MKNLHIDFQIRSKAALENVNELIKNRKKLSPNLRQEIFRVLHTLKGTSQTLGFSKTAEIAHRLETTLSQNNSRTEAESEIKKLNSGIKELIDSLELAGRLPKDKKPNLKKLETIFENRQFLKGSFFDNFSDFEKERILRGLKARKKFYSFEVVFELTEFSSKLKQIYEILKKHSEIVAVFPSERKTDKDQISFCLFSFFSGKRNELKTFSQGFSAVVRHHKISMPDDRDNLFSELRRYAAKLADELGKKIRVKIKTESLDLERKYKFLIFEICTHLIKNAIDHAIETETERKSCGKKRIGRVQIEIKNVKKALKITVEDDGRGIDTEKIRIKAIERKIISESQSLKKRELLNLIFFPEFSTANLVTGTSGRGMGLNAAKNLVENADGKINVKSRRGFGTTFEVIMPYDR